MEAFLAELVERDFSRFLKTGEKNKDLVILLKDIGEFETRPVCEEDICKSCENRDVCETSKTTIKTMDLN